MPGFFRQGTYAELEIELTPAVEWFERCGANVGQGRVGRYLKDLRELVAAVKAQEFSALKDRDREIATALYEADDIVSIHRAFGGGQYDSVIAERIRRVSNGPISYTAESPAASSNAARNFAFELLTAAMLQRGGLIPEFPSYADVATHVSGVPIAIQCKRLWSPAESAVRKNFTKAERQLKDAKKAGARGIVALDISRIANPRFGVLRSPDARHIRAAMRRLLESFLNSYTEIWLQRKDKTIALILRASTMAQQADLSLLTHCEQYAHSILPGASQSERETVMQIKAAFDTALAKAAGEGGEITYE